jgi:hypothetical protein
VVGINGLSWEAQQATTEDSPGALRLISGDDYTSITRKSYAAALDALKQKIPLHPFLRYLIMGRIANEMAVADTATTDGTTTPGGATAPGGTTTPGGTPQGGTVVVPPAPGQLNSAQVLALLTDKQQPFGGLLGCSWVDSAAVMARKDVPVLLVMRGDGDIFGDGPKPANPNAAVEGGIYRQVGMGKLEGQGMPFDCVTAGMSMLEDLVSVTHERLTSIERRDNLDKLANQVQELAGIVSVGSRRAYADFLMGIPGMDKRRRDYERLADVWLEASIVMTKEHEQKDLPEAHAFLSIIVRSERFKTAGGKQQKSAQTELARMRKDPVIKQEQAAADILANTGAMLDHDSSTAKQRIALKDLEAMVAQYPKTIAGKAAAKLLETLRQNLR